MLRLPWGLRVVADDCDGPPAMLPGKIANAIAKCNRNVVPKSCPNHKEKKLDVYLRRRMAQTFTCTGKGMRKSSNSGAPQAYAVVDCCKRLHKYMFPQTASIASNFSTVWGWGGVMFGVGQVIDVSSSGDREFFPRLF